MRLTKTERQTYSRETLSRPVCGRYESAQTPEEKHSVCLNCGWLKSRHIPATPKLPLYFGDNGVHAFWETTDKRYLFIRNHGEKFWQALYINGEFTVQGAKTTRALINRIRRERGVSLVFDTTHRWLRTRKNQRQMMLLQIPQPQY